MRMLILSLVGLQLLMYSSAAVQKIKVNSTCTVEENLATIIADNLALYINPMADVLSQFKTLGTIDVNQKILKIPFCSPGSPLATCYSSAFNSTTRQFLWATWGQL